jgi:hypothetical protein
MPRNDPWQSLPTLAAVALTAAAFAFPAAADVVTDWDATAIAVTLGPSTYGQIRAAAYMHVAMHDALNAVERRYAPYAVDLPATGGSPEAAAAAAAHTVLSALIPAQRAAIDAALVKSLAAVPDGPSKVSGIALGNEVGKRILALRADDGTEANVAAPTPPTGTGAWQLTPGWAAPILTQWPRVKPMMIPALAPFDGAGPTALTSDRWVKDYEEVKAVGARDSKVRTAAQTATAIFWTTQTLAPWHAVARAAALDRKLDLWASARLFALLDVAVFDSSIVILDRKYRTFFWRPYNAIRAPGGPGNPRLRGDPGWEPLLLTPGHPEYPSGHCTVSGAAAEVLRTLFPDDRVEASYTYPVLFGVTRTWRSFSEVEKEVENARVWGGIHFRNSDEHGTLAGRKVADYVVEHAMQPVAPVQR